MYEAHIQLIVSILSAIPSAPLEKKLFLLIASKWMQFDFQTFISDLTSISWLMPRHFLKRVFFFLPLKQWNQINGIYTAFDGCPKWMRKENSQLFLHTFNDMRWNIIFLGHKLVLHYISLHIFAAFLLPLLLHSTHDFKANFEKKMLIKCHKRSRQEKNIFVSWFFCCFLLYSLYNHI